MYRKLVGASLALYSISLLTTMAGMEIFSSLIVALILGGLVHKKLCSTALATRDLKVLPLGIDWALGGLVVVVVLGVIINGAPGIHWQESIGSTRWVILLYAIYAALVYVDKVPEKFFFVFLGVGALVAINGILMYLTGFNFVRWEAVTYGIGVKDVLRGSGFFSIPTTYAHSIAMVFCLGLAALITGYRPFKGANWFFVVVLLLIGFSIITSYTRAAYISVALASLLMAFLVSRKLLLKIIGIGLVIGLIAFASNEGFRARFTSIFDPTYNSNSARVDVWRAHLAMFKDYPLLGVGQHDNERRNEEYNIKVGQPGAFTGNAHNNYIQYLAGTGALGFLFYMAIIIYFLKVNYDLWRGRQGQSGYVQALSLGVLGAQVNFHIAGFMDANFKDSEVRHLYLFLVLIVLFMAQKFGNKGARKS